MAQNDSPVMQEVAFVTAQHKAAERGGQSLSFGSTLYSVLRGWESDVIREEGNVTTCATLLEFETALKSDCKAIFVPLDAIMQDSDIEKVCARNGAAKAIYKEVEKI